MGGGGRRVRSACTNWSSLFIQRSERLSTYSSNHYFPAGYSNFASANKNIEPRNFTVLQSCAWDRSFLSSLAAQASNLLANGIVAKYNPSFVLLNWCRLSNSPWGRFGVVEHFVESVARRRRHAPSSGIAQVLCGQPAPCTMSAKAPSLRQPLSQHTWLVRLFDEASLVLCP